MPLRITGELVQRKANVKNSLGSKENIRAGGANLRMPRPKGAPLHRDQVAQQSAFPIIADQKLVRAGKALQPARKSRLEISQAIASKRRLAGHRLDDRKQVLRSVRQLAHDIREMPVVLLASGDVANGDGIARHRPARAAHRISDDRDLQNLPDLGTAEAFQPQRMPVRHSRSNALIIREPLFREKPLQRQADGLGGGIVEGLLGARVPGCNYSLGRHAQNGLARGSYDGGKLCVGVLCFLALRDIDSNTKNRSRFTIGPTPHECAPVKPPYRAGRSNDSELLFECVARAPDRIEVCLPEARLVFRMDKTQNLVRVAGEFLGSAAEEPIHGFRPCDAVRRQIPFPHAHFGRREGECHSLMSNSKLVLSQSALSRCSFQSAQDLIHFAQVQRERWHGFAFAECRGGERGQTDRRG